MSELERYIKHRAEQQARNLETRRFNELVRRFQGICGPSRSEAEYTSTLNSIPSPRHSKED